MGGSVRMGIGWGAPSRFIKTAGNTRTESTRARLRVQYEQDQWRHGATGDFVRTAEQGTATAERYTATV